MLPSCIILSSALYVVLYKHSEVTLILSLYQFWVPGSLVIAGSFFSIETHRHTEQLFPIKSRIVFVLKDVPSFQLL